MKSLVRLLPVMWLGLVPLGMDSACPADNDVHPTLGEAFDLHVGQSAVFDDEGLTLTFDSVPLDSRCPMEVDCPWEGDATVSMSGSLQEGDMVVQNQFELHTNPTFDTSYLFSGYLIALETLSPYPRSPDEPIPPSDYVATLVVSRSPE